MSERVNIDRARAYLQEQHTLQAAILIESLEDRLEQDDRRVEELDVMNLQETHNEPEESTEELGRWAQVLKHMAQAHDDGDRQVINVGLCRRRRVSAVQARARSKSKRVDRTVTERSKAFLSLFNNKTINSSATRSLFWHKTPSVATARGCNAGFGVKAWVMVKLQHSTSIIIISIISIIMRETRRNKEVTLTNEHDEQYPNKQPIDNNTTRWSREHWQHSRRR